MLENPVHIYYTLAMSQKSDRFYEITNKLDDIRTLFYNALDYPIDTYSEAKDKVKRELLFTIQDLLNKAENL